MKDGRLKRGRHRLRWLGMLAMMVAGSAAQAALTITPSTWNIIGLDSNLPAAGPRYFPVGAKVCSDMTVTDVPVDFVWDSANPYINTRSGSNTSIVIPAIAAGGCADAYFEVEVTPTPAAFDTTRRYHISSGAASTPTPRELYVERLVSQGRNGVLDIKVDGVSVAAGGSMNLVVGNTYTIDLLAYTATQGYSQLESFINFSNTLFQILSVNTSYSVVSAGNSGGVTSPNGYLYSDACRWDNDPASPTYRSCLGSGNAGGTINTSYVIKILGGGGTSQTLNTLAHDFSGSSFHYNSDYSVSARYANIIDPALTTIAKSFLPATTNAGGITTLTFTLSNPNAGAISGLNFIDVFPTSPGAMTLASVTATNTCGGVLTDENGAALAIGSGGIKLSGGTIPANSSCIVQVVVTPDTTGSYTNTSNHLFVDALDTGKFATATLTVNSTPPPPPVSSTCAAPVTLATWTMETAAGTGVPPLYTTKAADVASAVASYTTAFGTNTISTAQGNPVNAWGGTAPTAAANGNGWGEGPASSANYFQFQLDTSNYGGVNVYFDINLLNSGDWAAPNSNIYIKSSADGGAYTVYQPTAGTYPQAGKAAWTALSAPAAATGSSTTTFRISSDGGGNKKPNATIYLDNVRFTGCTRPNPDLLTLSKSFASGTVAVNGTTTLTFNLANNNATSTANLTGIGFIDAFPVQALQGTVSVTNGNATVSGSGTAFGTQLAAGSIVYLNGVAYTVLSIGSATSLTLGANYAGASASGLSMSAGHTYVSTSSNTCGGTLQDNNGGALAAADGGIKLSGVTLAPGASCAIAVVVKANAAGALQNVSGFITSTETGDNDSASGVAKATLTAVLPPGMGKLFAPNQILANGTSTLTFTLTNPNQNDALSGVAFTDTFPVSPGAMMVASPLVASNTCGGTLQDNLGGALAAGDAGFSLNGATIPAGGSCTISVAVTAATIGTYTNTSGAVSAATAGSGNTASDTLTVTAAHPQIAMLKQVSNSPAGPWSGYQAVPVGGSVYYQFIVENPGDVDLTSVSVSDPDFGGVVAGCSTATLAKYGTITCTAGPVTAGAGVHINTATASGTYGATVYSDVSSAAYVTTSLTLTKSAAQSYFATAGDVLDYSYVVQNTGSATLQGPVVVSDDKTTVTCPAVGTAILTASLPAIVAGDGDNWFDPGEQITCTASYTVQAADVTAKQVANNASATISGVTSATVGLTVPLAPDLGASKTNNASGTVVAGDSFVWTLTVGNAASAGSAAAFADAQVLLTDDLPAVGASYAVGTVALAGGAAGTINCALTGTTLSCAASGTVTLPPGGSFAVPVTVTTTVAGTLANPNSGGICRADPGSTIAEIDEANNDCADTVTVNSAATPNLAVTKTSTVLSDPVNLGVNPKAIPMSVVQYTITVTNSGTGAADSDSIVITDVIPANMSMQVCSDPPACTNATPPVAFTCSTTPACGLSYSYASDVSYSNAVGGGPPYDYVPSNIDADGYDATVTGVRIKPQGTMNPSGGGDPSFSLNLKMRVR